MARRQGGTRLQQLTATAKKPRISEKHVQRQIVDYLRLLGAQVYVLGTVRRKGDHPGTMQTPGIPDLWAFLRRMDNEGKVSGCGVWIEVKAEGGVKSAAQKWFSILCTDTSTHYVCGNFDDVRIWLTANGWAK